MFVFGFISNCLFWLLCTTGKGFVNCTTKDKEQHKWKKLLILPSEAFQKQNTPNAKPFCGFVLNEQYFLWPNQTLAIYGFLFVGGWFERQSQKNKLQQMESTDGLTPLQVAEKNALTKFLSIQHQALELVGSRMQQQVCYIIYIYLLVFVLFLSFVC